MRVLIVGTRNPPLPVFARVRAVVAMLPDDALVISGDGGAVDKTAIAAAKERNLAWEEVPALWDRHGKRAGPKRNAEMVEGWWTDCRLEHPERGVITVRVRHRENLVVHSEPSLLHPKANHHALLPDWSHIRDAFLAEGFVMGSVTRCPPPDLAFVFWDGKSPGTKDTLALLEKHEIPTRIQWSE